MACNSLAAGDVYDLVICSIFRAADHRTEPFLTLFCHIIIERLVVRLHLTARQIIEINLFAICHQELPSVKAKRSFSL